MPQIYIVFLLYIVTIVLSVPVIDFLINNGLVISSMTSITRSVDAKETRSANVKRPADAKALVDAEESADIEVSTDVEGETDAEREELANIKRETLVGVEEERPADAMKLVLILYKYQY